MSETKDKPTPEGFWWCPSCKMEIGGCNVTHEEHCDRCGQYVQWVELAHSMPNRWVALRDTFACAAIKALLTDRQADYASFADMAEDAYKAADAMLAERGKR